MTISSTSNSIQYTGNGVTTAFSFPYPFYDNTDLVVTLTLISTGVSTTQIITTNYTVSGGDGASGTVTMLVAPSSLYRLTIVRAVPYTQGSDFLEGAAVLAETVEETFDRGVVLTQQVLDLATRSLKFPSTLGATYTGLLPAPVDGSLLVWDGVTGQIANATVASLSTSIDTVFTSLASGDYLTYNGTNWVNTVPPFADLASNNTFTATNTFTGKLLTPDDGELTIASGVITVTGVYHTVDTEGDAASDDLVTINGGADGQILVLRTENDARDVVIKTSGNIATGGTNDITLGNSNTQIQLQYDGAKSKWLVQSATASQGAKSDTSFQSIRVREFTATGAGTYTPTANTVAFIAEWVGGGGGGGARATNNGSNGNTTTFDSIVANGGEGGRYGADSAVSRGGAGGTGGSGTADIRIPGGGGHLDTGPSSPGGNNPLFPSQGASSIPSGNAVAGNKGCGGGGGNANSATTYSGGGGGGGEYCAKAYYGTISASYSYNIGTGGAGGSAGGLAGGAGGDGYIKITEFIKA